MRCNPFRGGVSGAATADGLGEVLTLDFLNRLVERQGVCVLYTHLGKTSQPDSVFPPRTIEALRRLSAFSERRDLLVTTTRRLLRYCLATRLVDIRLVHDDQGEVVYLDTSGIHGQGMPADVSGITIYVTDSDSARVVVDSVEVTDLRRNPADESGLQSVSLPWQPLCFPDI
jgi:hypothetical protein